MSSPRSPFTERKAVFLDKDGTLIRNIPFNTDRSKINLLPGVAQGLARLARMDFLFIIVTNQPGIEEGYISGSDFAAIQERVGELFRSHGLVLARVYVCPHRPGPRGEILCACRKPQPLLFRQAAEEWHIDLSRSWMIGDILDDVEAGHRAGTRAILISSGNETEWELSSRRMPDYLVSNMSEAATIIEICDHAGTAYEISE